MAGFYVKIAYTTPQQHDNLSFSLLRLFIKYMPGASYAIGGAARQMIAAVDLASAEATISPLPFVHFHYSFAL